MARPRILAFPCLVASDLRCHSHLHVSLDLRGQSAKRKLSDQGPQLSSGPPPKSLSCLRWAFHECARTCRVPGCPAHEQELWFYRLRSLPGKSTGWNHHPQLSHSASATSALTAMFSTVILTQVQRKSAKARLTSLFNARYSGNLEIFLARDPQTEATLPRAAVNALHLLKLPGCKASNQAVAVQERLGQAVVNGSTNL